MKDISIRKMGDVKNRLVEMGWDDTEAELLMFLFFNNVMPQYQLDGSDRICVDFGEWPSRENIRAKMVYFWKFAECLLDEVKKPFGEDSEAMLDQVIKCIVHGLPYKVILKCTSPSCANEIRRLMEDSNDYALSSEAAGCLVSARDIYEYRRIFKTPMYVGKYGQDVLGIARKKGWVAMSAFVSLVEKGYSIPDSLRIYRDWDRDGISSYEMMDRVRELMNP